MAGNYRSNYNRIGKSVTSAMSSVITRKRNEKLVKEQHERKKMLQSSGHKNRLQEIAAKGKETRRTDTHKSKVGVKSAVKVSEARTKEIKARTSLIRAHNKSKAVVKKTTTKKGVKK